MINLVCYLVFDLVQFKCDLVKECESFAGRFAAKVGIRNSDEGGWMFVWFVIFDVVVKEIGKFFIDFGLVYLGVMCV